MSDSVWPHRWQPTRLPRPWNSPGKNTGVGCHFLLQCMKVKSESEVAQSCLTLSDPMDCSLPGSSIHGIFQAGVLEWVPLPSLKLTWVHIKSVNPKGNQSWIFTGRTNVEAEALILWPPDANNWLLRKNCNAGKDWRREEKVTTQDEIVGWHHWLKDVSLSRLREMVMDRIAGHAAVHGVT